MTEQDVSFQFIFSHVLAISVDKFTKHLPNNLFVAF